MSCNFIFFIMLTLTVNTVFWGSALLPLSVNMFLHTVAGTISLVILNVITNWSVYTNGCYAAGPLTPLEPRME